VSNEIPSDPEAEQFSTRIHEGLKMCRTMVANYRAMLSGGANDNISDGQADLEPLSAANDGGGRPDAFQDG